MELTVRTEDDLLSKETNRRGRAAVRLQRPGHVTVLAEARGYGHATAEADVAGDGARVELSLESSSTLAGRVVGYTAGLPRLSVVAVPAADANKIHTTPVSETGEFHFDELPAGNYAVGLDPQAFQASAVVVQLEAGKHDEIELSLAATGDLDVTAILPADDGSPREASLRLVRLTDHVEVGRSFNLVSGAVQQVASLPAGTYTAELSVAEAASLPQQVVEVAAQRTTPVTFTWPAGRIAGRVSTPNGPGAGAFVVAFKVVQTPDGREVRDNNPELTTQAHDDGSYVLAGLSPGRYLVGVQHPAGLAIDEVGLGDGEDRNLPLKVESMRSLETRVVYRGRPVEGAMVSAVSEPYALNNRSASTDARGVAQLGYLTRGTYAVRAVWFEGDEGPLREARAEIDLDGSPGTLELRLD